MEEEILQQKTFMLKVSQACIDGIEQQVEKMLNDVGMAKTTIINKSKQKTEKTYSTEKVTNMLIRYIQLYNNALLLRSMDHQEEVLTWLRNIEKMQKTITSFLESGMDIKTIDDIPVDIKEILNTLHSGVHECFAVFKRIGYINDKKGFNKEISTNFSEDSLDFFEKHFGGPECKTFKNVAEQLGGLQKLIDKVKELDEIYVKKDQSADDNEYVNKEKKYK